MSDLAHVATRKGLFTISRGSGGWKITHAAFLGTPVQIVLHDARDNTLYAALGHGHFGSKLHRSSDGGQTWDEVGVPLYPEKPPDVSDLDPMRKTERPWSLEQIWALETGGPAQPGTLWCGTIPGGLFRSDDRGATWRIIRTLWDHPARAKWFGGGYDLPGIHSICVDPRNPKRLTVGVSCGGAWRTEDEGETWRVCSHGMVADFLPPEIAGDPEQQDPHLIANCAAAPNVFWTQHHCGIFRTTNDCESWHPIKDVPPSAFGFAVAVHPKNPDIAWFVPAIKDERRIPVDGKVVVTRTRDGGKTWDILRNGLPQEHAYDLTYRHALDVDETGERLMFGSTTGSLWAGDNGGDSWQTISTQLPPVYCVRFVKP